MRKYIMEMTGPDSIRQHILHKAANRSNLKSQFNIKSLQDVQTLHSVERRKKKEETGT